MSKNSRTTAISLVAVLALSFVALPVVEAQSAGQTVPNFNLGTPTQNPTGPLVPDTGQATIKVPWEYRISDAGYGFQTAAAGSTTMNWKAPTCEAPGIVITGALTTLVSPAQDGAGSTAYVAQDEHSFTVQATQDAPGETPIRCEFKAQVDPLGQTVAATTEKSTTHNIVVDFLGLISANVPSTIKQAGPQKEIKYDIEVSNLGNSRSTIRFDLLNAEGKGKWNPVTPSEIILESPSQGGQETSKVVSFQVSTPFKNGWNNDQTTFQLRMTPVSTKDVEKEGTPVTVNVLSRVRGVYVPSVEPIVMLGAVLGSAMVVRMLRRE